MSDTPDFGGDAGLDFSSEIAVEAPAAEESQGDVNWEERYRSEVQDRIKERERYKPIRQTFDRMHPDDAQAVQQFADAWASGNQDAAIKWMVDNAKTLAGDNFNSYIGQQQQQVVNNAVAQGEAANLTPEQVSQLVNQQLAAYQQEQEVQRHTIEIDQTLRELGLEPETPLAHAAIIAATNRPDLDLRAAVAEMENQLLQQAQSIVERRRSAGASMPAASPNGMPSTLSTGATPREKAMARLQQNGL